MTPRETLPRDERRPFGREFRDFLVPHTPVPLTKRRMGWWALMACVIAGPLALVIAPLPSRAALPLALFGAVIGGLYLTRVLLGELLGMLLFVFGIDAVTRFAQQHAPQRPIPSWEDACIVISAWVLVGFSLHLWRTRELVHRSREQPEP